jgi:ABC transporter DrrB family efflux protein
MSNPNQHRHPLLALTGARILEFWRDPGAIFWVFGFPVLLAIALGVAFRDQEPRPLKVALVAPPSQWEAFQSTSDLEFLPQKRPAALEALGKGRVDLVLSLGEDPAVGGVELWLDPQRPETREARLAVTEVLRRVTHTAALPWKVTEVAVQERGSRYIDFVIPGLLALNILGSGMWGLGYTIVDNRRHRLLRRFTVTPLRRSHFLLSFMLSRLVFLVLEIVFLLLAGYLVFDVHVRGSLLEVFAVALLGAACFSGIALLISSRTESPEVATGLINLVTLPMWIFSGVFFSYERFPEALHPFIKALPLTALCDSLRAVMNEGLTMVADPLPLVVMAAWGLLCFGIALKIFRWQ